MKATLAVLLCLSGADVVAQPTPPVFAAAVDSVYVDVFVVRDGKPVRGLTAAHFELRDEGVVQPVELVSVDRVPLVAVLAFDSSSSVGGPKLRVLQESGAAFLEGLAEADEAGLVTFNDEVAWRVVPTADKAQVARALATLRPRGGTALYDGVLAAATLPTARVRTLVVAFSDGQDNSSWLDARQLRAALDRSNALLHVVGLVPAPKGLALEASTHRPNESFEVARSATVPSMVQRTGQHVEARHVRIVRELAESTGGRFWRADSVDRVREAFAAVAESMRHRYVLRFEPPAGAKPGWRRLEVRLKKASGDLQARRGYWRRGK
ncbi:MAG: VWA domain-containing protein [Vicinamibacteria bacterium]